MAAPVTDTDTGIPSFLGGAGEVVSGFVMADASVPTKVNGWTLAGDSGWLPVGTRAEGTPTDAFGDNATWRVSAVPEGSTAMPPALGLTVVADLRHAAGGRN